jgi:hypothetical protein
VEQVELDQAIVLAACPAADEGLGDGAWHAATLSPRGGQCLEPGRVYFERLWAYPKR